MSAKTDTSHLVRAGLNIAKDFADLSGISYLAPVIGTLDKILELCDKVEANKKAAIALCKHCFRLMIAIHRRLGGNRIDENSDMEAAVSRLNGIVENAHRDLKQIIERKKWYKFLRQKSIEDDIAQYREQITTCLDEFHLIAVLDAREQDEERALLQRIADKRTHQKLDRIGHNTVAIHASVVNTETKTSELTDITKVAVDEQKRQTEVLFSIQESISGSGLMVMRVGASTIQRKGEAYSMSWNGAIDNYRGLHSEKGEVVVRWIRQCKMNDKVKRRFAREITLWKAVYEIDGGEHILPYWGYGEYSEHPFVFCPYLPEGSIMDYIRKHSDVDRRHLIRSIAESVKVLHDMKIVHGNIQGVNTSTGSPKVLLADFGLAKVMANNMLEFTNSCGYEITRWAAPEIVDFDQTETQIYSTPADVYAVGMTILEVMTGQQPYSNYTKPQRAFIAKVKEDELPQRPTDPEVVANGLDDALWNLLWDCWQRDSAKRPTIDEVVTRL
ncbi:kinase-like protein [Punctularia strigosozonata HHB-11173 SS5]|uniref:Kinase-like protein n=1 Tax=Punctularia strigosozonata (strain HHB-11173) TaxID=741275 RepID=R7S3N0_PUNST|nr:kinase-like protein [Punctularia strigosozonata HHB-11173 SS5]EIN03831.1 kinase-like protein [Punctularia strigosozonata HHB-11173 SS5]